MTQVTRAIGLILFMALFSGFLPLNAQQTGTVSFTVSSNPAGASISVDGVVYTTTTVFQWPVGSQHYVTFVQTQNNFGSATTSASQPTQFSPDGGTAYVLMQWKDNTGDLSSAAAADPNQIVTVGGGVTSLQAQISIYYRVILDLYNAPLPSVPSTCAAPGTPPPPGEFQGGLVYINNVCFWNNATLYYPANQAIVLNAFPYPGFVFLGWTQNLGNSAYLQSYNLTGPITLAPQFSPGKLVQFITNPIGLKVLVDRTAAPTTLLVPPGGQCPQNQSLPFPAATNFQPLCLGDFEFAPGSSHLVGAATPQTDQNGKIWVFDSWGDAALGLSSQGENAVYATDYQTTVSDVVTVNFIQGAQASFVTVPAGLQLSVDGRTNWPAYNFVWGIGSMHTVSAPPTQTDAAGRQYTFQGWSNNGPAAQTVTMDQTAVDSGFRLVAQYSVLSQLTVQSSPSGLSLVVGGAPCTTPCTVNASSGSTVEVTAPQSIAVSGGVRLDLASWSDGGAADHIYLITAGTQTLTANYATSYQLTAASSPAGGASFQFSPSTPDMFFPSGTQVGITAATNSGYTFRRWAGDLSGTYPAGTLTMTGPHSVTALLNSVPYIAPAGIQNSAGATPNATVAPGSMIVITGQNLAPDTVQGPFNPLAQTIDGVTATIGNQILPLLYVMPQQVVAQLPSNLAPGNYTMQIQAQGQPTVTGAFTAARNAPGLFTSPSNGTNYVLALHADGSAVNPGSPAAQGETIQIYGTGFGPYATPVPDGFYPPSPPPAVMDPVTLVIAGQNYQPNSTTAAPGYTGLVVMSLTIQSPMPAGTNADMLVQVNGISSSPVVLPLQ